MAMAWSVVHTAHAHKFKIAVNRLPVPDI